MTHDRLQRGHAQDKILPTSVGLNLPSVMLPLGGETSRAHLSTPVGTTNQSFSIELQRLHLLENTIFP
jgi:hypothetical protein